MFVRLSFFLKRILLNRNYLYIILGCLFTVIVYLASEYIYTGGQMGVPLDDTWIHFQFAENFSKGYLYQYNPGDYTAGTTSPLYVVVLGLTGLISKNFIISSIFLSALFYVLCCIFTYKISLQLFKSEFSAVNSMSNFVSPEYLSLIISLLTVFSGRLAWSALSGMETTMFTYFCIVGIYFHIQNLLRKSFNLIPTIMFSLATVARPEGYLLYLLYIFDISVNLIKEKTLKKNFLKLIVAITIFSLISFPYLIFSYMISGHFFPNTFRGQGGGLNFFPNPTYLRIITVFFFRDNFVIALFYLFSIIYYFSNIKKYFTEFRYVNLIMLWIVFLPLVSSFVIPSWRHHVRYLIPLIPFINILSIYFFVTLMSKGYFTRLKELIARKNWALPLLVCVSLIYYAVYAIALGKNTDNINNQQVKLADWVHHNVKPDETIALNDIGAIKFLSQNKIIDMAGLVTPEILRYHQYNLNDRLDSTNYLLKKNNVSYIIIYDNWYPEYLQKYGNELTFVTSAYLDDNTICGGDEMKVYKTNFTGYH